MTKRNIMRLVTYPLLILSLGYLVLSYQSTANLIMSKEGLQNKSAASANNDAGHLPASPDIKDNLKGHVNKLAREIGPRGYLNKTALNKTAEYISKELTGYGYDPSYQTYTVNNNEYKNIHVEIKGNKEPEEVIVIGAHYDTVDITPGADDNASGVAVLLELARLLTDKRFEKTIHLVAFTLEEPPFFRTNNMGSYKYAEKLKKEGVNVEGMICLESVGFYTDAPKSQFYPFSFFKWIYPDTGDFITFVSNIGSRGFLKKVKRGFKKGTSLPSETISAISAVPGIDFSDHQSFWKHGYDAIMLTDTAFYRNANYHTPGDRPETLDYARMAEVVLGLKAAVEEISR